MPDSAITRSRQTTGVSAHIFRRPLDPHYGPLTTMTITDEGGLDISWIGGQLRTPDGRTITIEAGSATCTDDAINHFKWTSGTTLNVSTVEGVHGVEICIGHIACQDGDIWEVHTEPTIEDLLPDIQDGLEAIFPLAVASGCLVSEDTDATAPLDVTVSAGVYYHDLHDAHVIAAFDTRTANTLIRCFIDGSGPETWNFTADGAQSEVDLANWNSGTSLIGTSVGKFYKGLFLISEDNVFWIYAQEEHNTVAQAIDAALPTIPAGLALFPRSVSYVYKHGDTAFEAATSDRWEDVRPVIAGSIAAGPITAHANLIGNPAPADDHTQYFHIDGRRALTGEMDAGAHSIGFTLRVAVGDGTTTIDWRLGLKFRFTFGAFNDTFAFTAPTKAGNLILALIQDAIGSRTATWPGTVIWPGGVAPVLSTAANAKDLVSFYWDGTNFYGQSALAFS